MSMDEMTTTPEQPEMPPAPLVPPTPVLSDYQIEEPEPVSQTEPLPQSVSCWNWGAALLAPFWLVAMRMWAYFAIYLVLFLLNIVISIVNAPSVKLVSVGLQIFSWYFLRYGNALAWKSRPWRGPEHFRKTQRVWLWWGLAGIVGQILLAIGFVALEEWLSKMQSGL